MDFIIDSVGDEELLHRQQSGPTETGFENVEDDVLNEFVQDLKTALENAANVSEAAKGRRSEQKLEAAVEKLYADMGWGTKFGEQTFKDKMERRKNRFRFDAVDLVDLETGKIGDADARIRDIENSISSAARHAQYHVSDRRLKIMRKREREKTKGPSWYNLPAPEITAAVKNDLDILKMRSALNPKRFYKKNDMEAAPKYFQIGKVMDSPLEHLNVRPAKKERKQTFVDELLADAEFNKYNKKKYKQIIEEKRKTTYKTYIKDKRKQSKMAFNKKKKEKKESC